MREARLVNTAGGALIGAGVGAGIAAIQGRDGDDIWKAAGIGAVGGGVVGAIRGEQEGRRVVQQKREAKANEAYLQRSIANARSYNSALASYNAKLEGQLSSINTKAEARAARRQAEGVVRDVNSELDSRQQFLSSSANSSKHAEMRSQKQTLENRRDKLAKMVARLEAIERTSKA